LVNHQFMNKLYDSIHDLFGLPFVDREQEVIALSTFLIQDSLKAALGTIDTLVYFMPFLPQMSGAGKTTIGVQLLPQARIHRDEILEILNRISFHRVPMIEQQIENLPKDQQALYRKEMKTQHITEQLDKFLGATYVRVSMDELPSPCREFPTLEKALQKLIRSSLQNNNITPPHGTLPYTNFEEFHVILKKICKNLTIKWKKRKKTSFAPNILKYSRPFVSFTTEMYISAFSKEKKWISPSTAL